MQSKVSKPTITSVAMFSFLAVWSIWSNIGNQVELGGPNWRAWGSVGSPLPWISSFDTDESPDKQYKLKLGWDRDFVSLPHSSPNDGGPQY